MLCSVTGDLEAYLSELKGTRQIHFRPGANKQTPNHTGDFKNASLSTCLWTVGGSKKDEYQEETH